MDSYNLDTFWMVESQYNDAPPKRISMRLKQVNLVEGKLDDTTCKTLKKKLANKTIQQTPGGLEAAAMQTSVMESAEKARAAPVAVVPAPLVGKKHVHVTRSVAKEKGMKIKKLFENENEVK